MVRARGLHSRCYDRLPDFLHRPALNLDQLTHLRLDLFFRVHPGILRVRGRPVERHVAGDRGYEGPGKGVNTQIA